MTEVSTTTEHAKHKRLITREISVGYSTRDKDEVFAKIDTLYGGWKIGYGYYGFEHTNERHGGFCTSNENTGYWTVVYSADDYYLWKLSDKAKQYLVSKAIESAKITVPDISSISLTSHYNERSPFFQTSKLKVIK